MLPDQRLMTGGSKEDKGEVKYRKESVGSTGRTGEINKVREKQ